MKNLTRAVTLLLVGSAWIQVSLPSAIAQNLPAACGSNEAKYKVSYEKGEPTATTSPADPNKATIYFIEVFNAADTGRVNRPVIKQGINGRWIGATQGLSYLNTTVSPGTYHLCSQWQAHASNLARQISLNSVNAKAGATYYFRAQILSQSGGDFSIDLEPVSPDEGTFLIAKGSHAFSKQN